MDVVTFFANPTIRDIGAVAILALVVLMILTGRLVPKATHDREVNAAVTRGDEWKNTAQDYQTVNQEIRDQNSKLIKANEVVEAFLKSAGPSIGDTTQPPGGA